MEISKVFRRVSYFLVFLICFILLSVSSTFAQGVNELSFKKGELVRPARNTIFTKEDLLDFDSQKLTRLSKPHSKKLLYVQYAKPSTLKTEYKLNRSTLRDYIDSICSVLNAEIVRVDSEEQYEKEIKKYIAREDVSYVMPIYEEEFYWENIGTDKTYPSDFDKTPAPGSGNDWWLELLGMPYVWKKQECYFGSSKCGGGENEVVVAVMDTGVGFENYSADFIYDDYRFTTTFGKSPNLSLNAIWTNVGEGYGTEDYDGNGVCGDAHGIDVALWYDNETFLEDLGWTEPRPCNNTSFIKEGRPNDDDGHGTAVANVVVGSTNDSLSHPSVAHSVKIMPIKISYPFGDSDALFATFGVLYAIIEGADILQISSGSDTAFPPYELAIQDALEAGIAVVAAAGNDGSSAPFYPAAYPGVISVGAVNPDLSLSNYSNYGTTTFVAPVGDLASEGKAIHLNTLSCAPSCTYPESSFTAFSDKYLLGTSFAAPQVSAALALVKSRNPQQGVSDLLDNLIVNATDLGSASYDSTFGYGLINTKESWENVWSTWLANGRTPTVISMAELDTGDGSRLFQSVRGDSGLIWTRYTIDGVNWSEWVSNGRTPYQISMKVFNPGSGPRLYQAVRGNSGLIWTRYTTNGESWSEWVSYGMTPLPITMEVFNGRLYQVVKGNSGAVWTRYTADGESWSEWVQGGSTPYRVAMQTYSVGGVDNRLFQAIRTETNRLHVRYTTDGDIWSEWNDIGIALADVTLASFNVVGQNKIFVATHDSSGNVLTSFSTDGSSWSSQSLAVGNYFLPVTMMQHGEKLFQVDISKDTYIKTRYTLDGVTWTSWFAYGKTPLEVTMVEFKGQLYQAVKGNSGLIWTRYIIK